MKYTGVTFFLGVILLAAWAQPLPAQNSYVAVAPEYSAEVAASDQPDSVLTIKKRVDEVNVLFIATDRHGKFVRNLTQTDFNILDDHKPPQAIDAFRKETDLPLQLGLLVDTSGSVRSLFDFDEEAAVSFLQSTLRPVFNKAYVMGFSNRTQ